MTQVLNPRYNFLRRDYWFGVIDSRPLSLFRIFLAVLLLKDALSHLSIAGLFYSDGGILPRSVLLDGLARPEHFSLMEALSSDWMVTLFFLVWAIVIGCLLVGYRTRTMTVLNFLITLSVHERNVYVLSGADTVLRLLSFWAIFLPLDDYYAVDALRHPREDRTAYAFPVRMIQLQVALIYLMTGLLKLIGEPWRDGLALYNALQLQTLMLPTGTWLGSSFPLWLLKLMNYQVLVTELGFIFFVFAPFFQPKLRIVGLSLAALLHIGIMLTMRMPLTDFSLIMFVSYIPFLDPAWAEWLETRLKAIPRVATWLVSINSYVAQRIVASPLPAVRNLRWRRGVLTAALGVTMLGIIWWNLDGFSSFTTPVVPAMPAFSKPLILYSGLWQSWNMFAPFPATNNIWVIIPGHFEDGTTLDVRTRQPVTNDIPPVEWGALMRWSKFEENINSNRSTQMLSAWAAYYCHLYNDVEKRQPGTRLATLEIHLLSRPIHAPDQPLNPIQDTVLWKHWCYEQYKPML